VLGFIQDTLVGTELHTLNSPPPLNIGQVRAIWVLSDPVDLRKVIQSWCWKSGGSGFR
jgi:hypothetical protein